MSKIENPKILLEKTHKNWSVTIMMSFPKKYVSMCYDNFFYIFLYIFLKYLKNSFLGYILETLGDKI
jgi:hypothetical protein